MFYAMYCCNWGIDVLFGVKIWELVGPREHCDAVYLWTRQAAKPQNVTAGPCWYRWPPWHATKRSVVIKGYIEG